MLENNRNKTELTRILIDHGIDIKIKDGWGMTALDLAKRRKEGLDVLALLSQDNIR